VAQGIGGNKVLLRHFIVIHHTDAFCKIRLSERARRCSALVWDNLALRLLCIAVQISHHTQRVCCSASLTQLEKDTTKSILRAYHAGNIGEVI
jgi:hypothetical protein